MNLFSQTDSSSRAPRLGYLLSQYPGVSHTFLLDEIQGLRKLGFSIETASINGAANERPLTDEEATEAKRTFYVKQSGALPAFKIFFRTLFKQPGIFFRGVRAALTGTGADLHRLLYACFYFAEALLLVDWMEQHKLRHLHVHFGGSVSQIARIAAKAMQVPYSMTLHGPGEFFDETIFHLKPKIEDAAFTICISDFGRAACMRIAQPKHWARIHVARLGVKTDIFAARTPRSIAVPVQILCVGRLVSVKGQRVLLDAAGLLAQRGHSLHITFIGDGMDWADLAECTRKHNLEDSIYFVGSLTHAEIRTRMAEADVFVLPSFAEGIPVALMEAMATQLACVSTFSSGIPELITNDVDGLLVQPGDVEGLANALESLLNSSQLRSRVGLAARQKVLSQYEQSTNLQRTADIFLKNIAPDARAGSTHEAAQPVAQGVAQ